MDFFQHQEDARRNTRRLVALFALAVVAIVAAVNAAAAAIWLFLYAPPGAVQRGISSSVPGGLFFGATCATLLIIGGGTVFEMLRLREGGDAVARMIGGRLLPSNAQAFAERRLLNIVEEMALASGVSMPRVYVLDQENAINAFAAGYSPNEAVVAVSHGALTRLTREELQGVVAHEFSHILNGDMRLNLRLIGVLYGILLIAVIGEKLMEILRHARSGRSRDAKGSHGVLALYLMGAAMWIIGYVGVFFARLIKAAVSREREYLADAAAVQFTRNRDGIGGALRKIGGLSEPGRPGSHIDNAHAETLSHLFLGPARRTFAHGFWATHPPLEERIRRIFGRAMPVLPAPALVAAEAPAATQPTSQTALDQAAALPLGALAQAWAGVPPGTADHVAAAPAPSHRQAPLALIEATREPRTAAALALALAASPEADHRTAQFALVQETFGESAATVRQLAEALDGLEASYRLPLLDLAVPALRQHTESERNRLLMALGKMVELDRRVTLSEFVLQTIVERRLLPLRPADVAVRFNLHRPLAREVGLTLSLMAHVVARDDPEQARAAFGRGRDWLKIDAPFTPLAALAFRGVRDALHRLNQLAPLAKPALIKAWVVCATGKPPHTQPLKLSAADLLRALCSAIDAPLPPLVSDHYAAAERELALTEQKQSTPQ